MMNTHPQGGAANGVQRPNAGIDVSKEHLDLCIESTSLRATNDAQGWNDLTATLLARGVDVVVLEAAGGYERGVLCALQQAGVAVARLNPRQARDFADVLAAHKDRARCITPMQEQHRLELAELMTRRRQLVDMRVAENNRLEHAGRLAVRSIKSVLKTLDKHLQGVDDEIDQHMERHFKPQRQLLDSVKGVGPVTILTLTAALPALGQLD
jgi:transposase